jgi:predicted ATP-binding protein involved in virulence
VKVTKIHIDEYKVFKDFDIDFTDREGKAQNLIVLAGINGTGKTTLLEFIFSKYTIKRYFGDKNQEIPYLELVDVSVSESGAKKTSKDDSKFNKGSLFVALTDNESIELNQNSIKLKERLYYFKVHDFNKEVLESITKEYIDKFIYGTNPVLSSVVYSQLSDFINSIFSDFLLGFKFKRYGSEHLLYFETAQGAEVSLNDLSTGERQLINFALQLFVAGIRDSIILIDEPEFSLHPSWQNKIVGVLQKYADEYNCQVILATHSPHIIGSVRPEQLRLLYKDESGAIKVKEHIRESYGLPFDQVLTEVMGVEYLRTPKVEDQLNELRDLIKLNEYDSANFKNRMKEMEGIIGYSDKDLILMRFEIAKRKKESAAHK